MDTFQRELIALLPRLRRFARSLTRAPADADDLIQLTVERALLSAARRKPGTRLDYWMFRTMKNAWIDNLRSDRRKMEIFLPEEAGQNAGDDGAITAERQVDVATLEREIQRLPEEQRLAVALVLVEGLGYREAAEVLEIPQGTLTSRLGRGRAALLARMTGEVTP